MRHDLLSYVKDIDASKRILEIGPLATPVLEGQYVDVQAGNVMAYELHKLTLLLDAPDLLGE